MEERKLSFSLPSSFEASHGRKVVIPSLVKGRANVMCGVLDQSRKENLLNAYLIQVLFVF